MECRFRPLTDWTFPASHGYRSNPFSATWGQTRDLLESEISKLGASRYTIELALDESEIRLDGYPRANARPRHAGVVVSFDSKHGPLRYGTDEFSTWQANVRAIALGLEALRAVEVVDRRDRP